MRGLDGIETLIPNEKLITDVVQNHSSYLTRGNAKVAVQVSYRRDVDLAMTLLVEATQDVERVLQDPAPAALLASFGTDGINLELGFWIEDAAKGTGGVRSQVNRNIWRLFSAHGIEIPFAQREIRIIDGVPLPPADAVIPTAAGDSCKGRGSAIRRIERWNPSDLTDMQEMSGRQIFLILARIKKFLLWHKRLGTLEVECDRTRALSFHAPNTRRK